MSFRTDLWNGFDCIKKNFLLSYNKIKHIYDIMNSFASIEKSHSKNLELLYEQNKSVFESDEIFLIASKNFISSLRLESEYHKYFYTNIIEKILPPLKELLEIKKTEIGKNFAENFQNFQKFSNILQNLVTKQEIYHNSCRELATCLAEIEILTSNNENKKKQSISKMLINKKEKALEKVRRSMEDYLLFVEDSNVILKDYNIKTENILNDLQEQFALINNRTKEFFIDYSKNKIRLHKDILEVNNNYLVNFYEKINIDNEIQNYIKNNTTKEFRFNKFEFIPFKLNNITKNLFSVGENNEKKEKEPVLNLSNINYDKIIRYIKKYFVDNNLSGTDSDFLEYLNTTKKKTSYLSNIKYSAMNNEKNNNNNLINELPYINNISNKNNSINNLNDKYIANKTKEISNNIKIIENCLNKVMTTNEKENKTSDLDKDINQFKSILQKEKIENLLFLDAVIKSLNTLRAHGNYILNEKSYDDFINILNFLLDNFSNQDNLMKNIIIFSQTFYKVKPGNKNPKLYILNAISNHPIFNKVETWHRIINYSLSLYINNKDMSIKISKEENESRIDAHIMKILIEYLADMKVFKVSDKIFSEVRSYYIDIYKINGDELNKEIVAYLKDNLSEIERENDILLIKGKDKEFFDENLRENIEKSNNNNNVINNEKQNEEINDENVINCREEDKIKNEEEKNVVNIINEIKEEKQ